MTVKITSVHSEVETTRTFTITVEGAEDLQRRHAKSLTLRPTSLIISYLRHNAEPWYLHSATVGGRRVLKDGRLSTTHLSERLWAYSLEDWPDWAAEQVKACRKELGEED